jgi:hypothetical protein
MAFDALSDPGLATQAARIRDQYFSRIEGTVVSHRRLFGHVGRLDGTDSKTEEVQQTKYVEAMKPASPSDEELPPCWKKKRRKLFKS